MGQHQGWPLWADATRGVWRRGWPVLVPVAAALPGPLSGAAPVLVVIVGAALLAPARFAVLCLVTLVMSALTWSGGSGLEAVAVLIGEGAVTVPFVIAGRALRLSRRRAAHARVGADSRVAVTLPRGR